MAILLNLVKSNVPTDQASMEPSVVKHSDGHSLVWAYVFTVDGQWSN